MRASTDSNGMTVNANLTHMFSTTVAGSACDGMRHTACVRLSGTWSAMELNEYRDTLYAYIVMITIYHTSSGMDADGYSSFEILLNGAKLL